MMTPSNAWRVLADRAQSTVTSDDEQIVVCDALCSLAFQLHLQDEFKAAQSLSGAVVARMNAQMEFRGFLNPEARQ